MSLLSKIKNSIRNFRKQISAKLAFWIWLIILFTIILQVLITLPFQRKAILNRMDDESIDIANSILHANSSSLITEEYGLVVDHCIGILRESKSILYLKLIKRDGYTLVFTKEKWEEKTSSPEEMLRINTSEGQIIYSSLIGSEVFNRSVLFDYSGLKWGYVKVGLSLDYYNESTQNFLINIIWFTIIIAALGFISSFFFAKKISRPIVVLYHKTKEIAEGKLDSTITLKTGDELESLADSFNRMTDSLRISRDNLEAKVRERTRLLEETNEILIKEIVERTRTQESLQKSIKEKDILLKEIHHRVKNNLQIITSLLGLQSKKVKDQHNLEIFKDSQSKVKSMALVHEKLYQSIDSSKIDLAEYITSLVGDIRNTYTYNHSKVETTLNLEASKVPIDIAVPLGLILNELITNAFKYAFPHQDSFSKVNQIIISSSNQDHHKLLIEIIDNGIGLPSDFSIEKSNSLGLKLVTNLVYQINGDLHYESNQGTKFSLAVNLNSEEE